DLVFRARYFSSVKEGFELNENIGRLVRFFSANLLEPSVWVNLEPYDFIFCRNLLIYLDRAAQQSSLDQLEKMIAPSGVLFVGAAEPAIAFEHGFVSANLPMAFACRKTTHTLGKIKDQKSKIKNPEPPAPISELEAPALSLPFDKVNDKTG